MSNESLHISDGDFHNGCVLSMLYIMTDNDLDLQLLYHPGTNVLKSRIRNIIKFQISHFTDTLNIASVCYSYCIFFQKNIYMIIFLNNQNFLIL